MEGITTLARNPLILMPKKHIFLLSHMRAYTSLCGHILGSNPAVCGYYEMHIGYYSWRSKIRQKLLFFKDEKPKPRFSFMFDKVLHNEHRISPAILNSGNSRFIFCLRPPEKTVPSILKLFHEVDPSSDYASPQFATRYYIQRVLELERMASSMQLPFFYFDACLLKLDPDNCLAKLSRWIPLETALESEYDLHMQTSKPRYGDTSDSLRSGKILKEESNCSAFDLDNADIMEARDAYLQTRGTLIRFCEDSCVMNV